VTPVLRSATGRGYKRYTSTPTTRQQTGTGPACAAGPALLAAAPAVLLRRHLVVGLLFLRLRFRQQPLRWLTELRRSSR